MKLCLLFKAVFTLFKSTVPSTNQKTYKLIKYRNLSPLCETQSFSSSLNCIQMFNQIDQSVNSNILIKKLIDAFWSSFVITVVLTTLSMLTLVGQPFLNNLIKQLISQKFDHKTDVLLVEVVGLFLGWKLVSSFLFIASDFISMILGVKINSYMVMQVIKASQQTILNPKMIACIEDDCERIQNLPYCSLNSVIKIVQFVIFCSLLINRIPNYKITITMAYCVFLLISLGCASYSSRLNLKIMHWKQKRIDFGKPSVQLQMQRDQQIKSIKQLMVIDGIGLIMPWVLNIFLMVTIYGTIQINPANKYFILMIFGLIRSSISGMGTNLNLFAQAWSSLNRISSYIEGTKIQQDDNSSQINKSLHTKISQTNEHEIRRQKKQVKLMQILSIVSQYTLFFRPIILWLIALVFISNFLYGYCARSIIKGESIFSQFNIITLSLQLISPILLYSFICYSNQNVSKTIYPHILDIKRQDNKFSSEDINRLSGDIRLVDRQFYFCLYGTISHIAGISSSFIFSSVVLGNIFTTIALLLLITLIAAWLVWIFSKFMNLRKECYRKQAVSKGFLINKLKNNLNFIKNWKKIYTFKYFGYTVEIAFISLLYTTMTALSVIFIIVVMLSNTSTQSSAVLIMLITQLDSQLLILFLQATILQISATAMQRCFNIFRKS